MLGVLEFLDCVADISTRIAESCAGDRVAVTLQNAGRLA
jgi:hypothetical protein